MSPLQVALNLGQRAHIARGRTLRGRWGLLPLLPKRGLVVPKVFTSKDCISGSQGRWTLDFCLEAIKSLGPFINISSGLKHKKTIFNTSALAAHEDRKYAQNANTGTYIPMAHEGPYNMAYTRIEGPIVRVYKHTPFRSSPPFDAKPIMHAYGHVCKRQVRCACPQCNII